MMSLCMPLLQMYNIYNDILNFLFSNLKQTNLFILLFNKLTNDLGLQSTKNIDKNIQSRSLDFCMP